MTSPVLSSVGVAGILAHLLLIGASLVLKGIALKQTSRPARFALNAGALALAALALILADTWYECVALLVVAATFAPLLLGLVVIRNDQALANIQQQMVDAKRGVCVAELRAQAAIHSANGEAESTKLRAIGEADAIRATVTAKQRRSVRVSRCPARRVTP
jgi:regulator of protease activity HflC (stomatin/prohibitin superfamily)